MIGLTIIEKQLLFQIARITMLHLSSYVCMYVHVVTGIN